MSTAKETAAKPAAAAPEGWRGFTGTGWQNAVAVREFIVANYTPYTGDANDVRGVSSDGSLSGNGAHYGHGGVAPACTIA